MLRIVVVIAVIIVIIVIDVIIVIIVSNVLLVVADLQFSLWQKFSRRVSQRGGCIGLDVAFGSWLHSLSPPVSSRHCEQCL